MAGIFLVGNQVNIYLIFGKRQKMQIKCKIKVFLKIKISAKND